MTTATRPAIDGLRLSQPQDSSTYLAFRTTQGGRVVYTIRVPLMDLPTILPVPDPNTTDHDNRRVDRLHAKDFGSYLHRDDWVAPALLARDSGGCVWDPVDDRGDVGYLTVPWAIGGVSAMRTIDGQHRILGVSLEKRRITDSIYTVERDLSRKVTPERGQLLKSARKDLVTQMERLRREYIGLDIYVEPDQVKAQQMFVDVADNAKGISSAVRSRFDNHNIANRTLVEVIQHPLLHGRVDPEQDRMTPRNPNLLGAKHVADITRAVLTKPGGRLGKIEREMSDGAVVERVREFLDVITDSFKDLSVLADQDPNTVLGGLTGAQTLRQGSLLGSVGMLRVLAGVYRELRYGRSLDLEDIVDFFRSLDPHMSAPIADDSIWRTTGAYQDFEPHASAPIMRTQHIVHLVSVVSGWHESPPVGL